MLTRKQYELLTFIEMRLKEDGISPSFEEMKIALDLKSKSGIHRLITALVERGFIRRLPHRARALEVLRLPENRELASLIADPLEEDRPDFDMDIEDEDASSFRRGPGEVILGKFTGALPGAMVAEVADALSLPLYGKIAAGTPIEALRDHANSVHVPSAMVGAGEHYCLTVEGDSMIDAGILDGDVVIIRRGETAENGTIVVALVDGHEATLKRLRRKRDAIALEPCNRAYETRIFPPDRVVIQGRLVGLMRSY